MLVRLLFTGDEKAYKAIYLRYWRSLFSVAVWKTNDKIVAEELVQELFMGLWENREKTLIGNLEAYLKTALRYSIIVSIKAKLAKSQTELNNSLELSSDQRADTEISIRELSDALQQALTLLPEKTRHVFQMSRFEQKSASEIAEHLGITQRAVEYHITQSLRLLRLELKDYLAYGIIFAYFFNFD